MQLWLIRHGETEWSLSGAHTSRTDIPLTEKGRGDAAVLGRYLRTGHFPRVFCSPRQRAIETCEIAGFGKVARIDDDLSEWDYGQLEGRTTAEIRRERPDWTIWDEDPPGGENLAGVALRSQRMIDRCVAGKGPVALFSHAHFLRILTAVWLGLPPRSGSLFALTTASVSILGFERERRVIEMWNRSIEAAQ